MGKSSIHIIPDTTGNETNASPSITFDVVTTFKPKRSREVSSSPVDTRSFVSELLSDKGRVLTIEAYVSDTPILLSAGNLIDSKKADIRTKAAFLALDDLYNSEKTVTIVYGYETLYSHFLTSFEPIITSSNSIGFMLNFEEVRFASEKKVTLIIPMSDEKTKEAATPTTKGTTTKEEETSSAVESILAGDYGLTLKTIVETGDTLSSDL